MGDQEYRGQIQSGEFTSENISWRLSYRGENELYPVFAVSSLSSYCELTEHIRKAWSVKARERLSEKRGYVGEILPWFRGVRDKSYTLTPMLAREWIEYCQQYESIGQLEDYYYDRFTRFGRPFLGGIIPNDIIEWNYIMRHHDIPSRLLDWTKGSLIALSYATMRSLEPNRRFSITTTAPHHEYPVRGSDGINASPKKDAAVWMLEPRRLMEVATSCLPSTSSSSGTRNIPTKAEDVRKMRRDFFLVDPLNEKAFRRKNTPDEISNLEDVKKSVVDKTEYWKYPLPLIPSHISARVGSHLSRFTLHSLEAFWGNEPPQEDCGMVDFAQNAFDDKNDQYWYLVKIELPSVSLSEIARGLRMTGVGDMNFTQDLDGLARELHMRADLGLKDDIKVNGDKFT